MKVLITGCRGQLGTELQKQLRQGTSELGPASRDEYFHQKASFNQ